MSAFVYLCRYFQVVPPIPSLLTACFVVLTLAGTVAIVVARDGSSAPLVPVLVLQAFSSSTGFAAPARRGYFDVLIARGEPRVRIALVQWVTAIAPGLACWCVLAGVRAWTMTEGNNPLTASGTLLAFALVSTLPWAVTVALPRFSGAIGWLLVVCLGAGWNVTWPEAVRVVLFPIAILGHDAHGRLDLLLAAVVGSALPFLVALAWVHRTDIPLEAAQ